MDTKDIDRTVERLFSEWRGLAPLEGKGREAFQKKTRLEWNYHSNRIEGNTLTYGETELLLMFGRCEGGHQERHYMEMKAHDAAIKHVQEMASDGSRPLAESDIRTLNLITLKEPFFKRAQTPDGGETKKKIEPGMYKRTPNHVRTPSGELFKFAEPEDVPVEMRKITERINLETGSPSGSVVSFLAKIHHDFLRIHPFDDGNGRVGRMLLNYVLTRLGYPPMVVKINDKERYLSALSKADAGDIVPLEAFLGTALISWLRIGIKAAKGEDISEPDDVDKEAEMFARSKRGSMNLANLNAKEVLDEGFLVPLAESLEAKFAVFKELFENVKGTVYSLQVPFAPDCTTDRPLSLHSSFEKKFDIPNNIHGQPMFHKHMNFDLLTATTKERCIFDHYLEKYYNSIDRGSDKKGSPMISIRVVLENYKWANQSHLLALMVSMTLLKTNLHLQIDVREKTDHDMNFIHNYEDKKPYSHVWTKDRINALLSKPKAAMLEGLKRLEGENP